MTVSELIERLQQFHPDLPVYKLYQINQFSLITHLSRERFVGDDAPKAAKVSDVTKGVSHEAVVL